jgi:predicted transcriptional regulator
MSKRAPLDLGRRERQIMEAVYARGKASVAEVLADLPDQPSYSTVRAILNTLEKKGHLRRKKSGKKFLYLPTLSREKARRSAMSNMLATFFSGSAAQAMSSLMEMNEKDLSEEELAGLSKMIEDARKGGR